MIRSLTGFGRATCSVGPTHFQIEIRTLNHRHLDVQLRLPRLVSTLESEIRAGVRRHFARGRVDLAVSAANETSSGAVLEVDFDAAGQYVEAAEELRRAHGVAGDLEVRDLLALPGVARLAEATLPEEELRDAVLSAVEEAALAARSMREHEGAELERELRQRLGSVVELVAQIELRADSVSEMVRKRLQKRAESLQRETGLLDEARLHQEVVLAADRLDVREELVRLRSHVEQFELALEGDDEPVGRRLDFLLQEFAREGNTIGSKGSDGPIAHLVVDLKTELERIREQVQNVE